LASLIEPFFARSDDEVRAFLKTVFRLPGDIVPDHERQELRVRLYGLANNRSQKALIALCDCLNAQQAIYPGTTSSPRVRGDPVALDLAPSQEFCIEDPDDPEAPHGRAISRWRERLAFLLEQQAIAADPSQGFQLKHQIDECRAKLRELGESP
jgi:hypothetical protein